VELTTSASLAGREVVVFDLDGTLLDSDAALLAPFAALGVDLADVRMGTVVGAECERLGVSVEEYVARNDEQVVRPFAGVEAMLAGLDGRVRWAVCSNKHPRSGHAELGRLGWAPEVVMFTDSFGGGPKAVGPVLEALGVDPAGAVFVGDTGHDRTCARTAGVPFLLAGWNPRARPADGDVVLHHPGELLDVLGLVGE
jgi:HAD superfamily hydrolase (TIGR01549 family)